MKQNPLQNILLIAIFGIIVYLYMTNFRKQEEFNSKKKEQFSRYQDNYRKRAKEFLDYFENIVEPFEGNNSPNVANNLSNRLTNSYTLMLFYVQKTLNQS